MSPMAIVRPAMLAPSLLPSPQRLVDGVAVELLRVELTSDPLPQLRVPLVLRVLDRLHQLLVAPRAAAVLGRARPLPGDAPRVADARLGGEHLLHLDRVLPVVAEVV